MKKITSWHDPECQPVVQKIMDSITQAYCEVYKGSLDVVVTSGELLARGHLLKGA